SRQPESSSQSSTPSSGTDNHGANKPLDQQDSRSSHGTAGAASELSVFSLGDNAGAVLQRTYSRTLKPALL
ncbi:hypothetical protein ACFPOB_30040, partial [Bosea eneae]